MGVWGLSHREAVCIAYCVCDIWHVYRWDVASVQEISEIRRQSLFKQLPNVSWKQAWSSRPAGPEMRKGKKRVHWMQSPTDENWLDLEAPQVFRKVYWVSPRSPLWKLHGFSGESLVLSDAKGVQVWPHVASCHIQVWAWICQSGQMVTAGGNRGLTAPCHE